MERFYTYWCEEEVAPRESLRKAQKWLRDTDNKTKAAMYTELLSRQPLPGRVRSLVFQKFVEYLNALDPDECLFSHPYWWAGFFYTGA
jgi:CHAT domain-containing protein